MNSGIDSRVLAAQIVHAVLFDGRSLKSVLNEALPGLVDPRDRALTEAAVMAVIRHRTAYQQTIDRMMPRPLGRRDSDLRALLYIGIAQLDAMGLPAHAALDTTVEAARAIGRSRQASMVNAILRRVQREGVLSLNASAEWPDFLVQQLREDWGDANADGVFKASSGQAPLFLRVNPKVVSRDAYLQQLADAGIAASAVADFEYAIELNESISVHALPGFAYGTVSVQDLSAQATAYLPGIEGRVLDACAAPGGKSAALLETREITSLVALDNNARRLKQIDATLQRVGAVDDRVSLQVADARLVKFDDQFDAVILDVPCSATGVVRRQPDVLLHRRPEDLANLLELQADILRNGWKQVRPGGTMLYCTCSILKSENMEQIKGFLAFRDDAQTVPIAADGYGLVCEEDGAYYGHQRLTGDRGADGFFYCLLRKAG